MRRSLPIALLVTTAAAFAAGCPHPASDRPDRELGGLVTLTVTDTGASALAFFVNSSGFLASDFAEPAHGCAVATASTPSPTPASPEYRDAGATVTLASATTSLEMAAVGGPAPNYIYYSATPPVNQIDTDSSWDVSLSGSSEIPARTWPGALRLRHPPPASSNLAFPASGAFAIQWTRTGADFVRIDIYEGAGAVVTCFGPDSGSLTVPGDASVAIPSGSGNFAGISAVSATRIFLDRGDVVLLGTATTFSNYTKP